jgi:hypothetical protein
MLDSDILSRSTIGVQLFMRGDQEPEEEISSFLGANSSEYNLVRLRVERLRDSSSLVSQLFLAAESEKMALFLITDHLLDDPLYLEIINAFAQQSPSLLSLFSTQYK